MKKITSHILCVAITFALVGSYTLLRDPSWWNERLRLGDVEVLSDIEKPVYVTHKMDEIAFQLRKGDRCIDISNESFSFGVPDRESMGYTSMLIICPGKGAGWVKNSW